MNHSKGTSSFSSTPRKILYPLPACARTESIIWVGLSPLEMIQRVSLMTVTSLAVRPQNEIRFQCGQLLIESFVTDTPQQGVEANAGQKRKRDCFDETIVEIDSSANVLESVVVRPSDYSFHRWTATLPVSQYNSSRLDFLVSELERAVVLSTIEWCLPSYNRVQQEFLSEIARAGGDSGKRLIVVNKALLQMQALVDMVSVKPARADLIFNTNKKMQSVNFNSHMTTWITCNWQNPFPDDEMFELLSNFMIENRSVPMSSKDIAKLDGGQSLVKITTEKLVNWLVNFRSRSWRPSIEQAFNLRRPASLLLEDSLRIFQKKDLRPLIGWDDETLFSFDPKYLTPIKTWKRNKGTQKIKKSKAIKQEMARSRWNEFTVI